MNQFVNKDDKHAMEAFVEDSLTSQVKQMLSLDSEDEDLESAMEKYRATLEDKFAKGMLKQMAKQRMIKPKPDGWDSDMDGHWVDQPGVLEAQTAPPSMNGLLARRTGTRGGAGDMMDLEDEDEDEPPAATQAPTRRGGAGKTTKAAPAPAKKPPAKKAAPAKKPPAKSRAKKPVFESDDEDDEEDEDVFMDDGSAPATAPKPAPRSTRSQPSRARAAAAAAPSQTAKTRQTKLNFSQAGPSQGAVEISDDEISDDDAFEPPPAAATRSRRK